MMRNLVVFILLFLPVLTFGQTTVVERDGTLTQHEKQLLDSLNSTVIPTPDTVVVKENVEGANYLGQAPIYKESFVELSPRRKIHVDSLESHPAYLYGQEDVTNPHIPSNTLVLAHEVGHIVAPKFHLPILNRLSPEREADVVGLVLLGFVFDVERQDVGFPDSIYVEDKKKAVKDLRNKYCQIIKTQWKMYDTNCQ